MDEKRQPAGTGRRSHGGLAALIPCGWSLLIELLAVKLCCWCKRRDWPLIHTMPMGGKHSSLKARPTSFTWIAQALFLRHARSPTVSSDLSEVQEPKALKSF